jgi:very-short-patch-repair endonuclease
VRGMVTEKTVDQRKAQSVNRERARTMRTSPVAMEQLFWSEVRNRKLGGYKFKRQHLIGHYIVDFVCLEHRLVVELDGPFHAERAEYDARRDGFLQAQGYRVLRFPNSYAADDIGIVLLTVKHALDTGAPSP